MLSSLLALLQSQYISTVYFLLMAKYTRLRCAAALIAHASAMLPRSGAWFTSRSLSLEHLLGRDGGNALSSSEGSVGEVHCYHTQDLMAKSLSLT